MTFLLLTLFPLSYSTLNPVQVCTYTWHLQRDVFGNLRERKNNKTFITFRNRSIEFDWCHCAARYMAPVVNTYSIKP